MRTKISSLPNGAEILLDGKKTGVATDGWIEIPVDGSKNWVSVKLPGWT